MVFIFVSGSKSTSILEKNVGNCQFCGGTDTVDVMQQTVENKLFGIFPVQPQIHRLAKCRTCKKSIKEEYYEGRTTPMSATKEDCIATATATAN